MKSHNLLLTDDLKIRLCDFGLSRKNDAMIHMTPQVGTFEYMAPELLFGDKYGYPVDVFSYGTQSFTPFDPFDYFSDPIFPIRSADGRSANRIVT